jgi:DNA-binding NarL/FixJ family response regulator
MDLILTASSSPRFTARCREGLHGYASSCHVGDYATLAPCLTRGDAATLLLDVALPGLNGTFGIAELLKVSHGTRIVAFSESLSDDLELALFRAGVRGVASSDIDPQMFKRIVVAVKQGELWIRRSITHRLLEELREASRVQASVGSAAVRLEVLTNREREIAALIGCGETNKQIARQLSITERTVKSHLTEIFRKLGIGDRVRLALRITGSRHPDSHNSA